MAGVKFQINGDLLSGLRIFHYHVAVVVPVTRYHDFGGKGAERLPVDPEQRLIAAHLWPQEQRPSRQLLRNLPAGPEPAVYPFSTPVTPHCHGCKKAFIGDLIKGFPGLIEGNGKIGDLLENHCVQSVLISLQLRKHPVNLFFVEHNYLLCTVFFKNTTKETHPSRDS